MPLPAVLPDTNYLMDYPFLDQENWLIDPIEVLISETVTSELSGLSNNEDPDTALRARIALKELQTQRALSNSLPAGERHIRFTFVPRYKEIKPPLEALKPDHQLIACARSHLIARQPRFCAILTNDKELSDIAEALSVLAIGRDYESRFHQELYRKYEWWKKAHPKEGTNNINPKLVNSPAKNDALHRQAQLERTAWRLARRLRAAGSSAALYIAPVSGRIELVIQIIKHNLKLKNRYTLVVLASLAEANFWAAELRQRDILSSAEITAWGASFVNTQLKSKINFCSYSQVESVFPKYVTRLHQAGSRLTVLADGCDAMDPVAAAVLLNESDQFFGIKRFPAGYQRTPSSRLMNVALRNNLVLEYTFGDAERDGWGHPFELVLHKIEFTPGELSYWDEINAKFIQRRQRAFENHPELSTCADFWETLNEVLSNAVDMEDVELIKVREEREQLAQLAQNKASCVFDLFAESAAAPAPYRRLVFDCERQWTHLLLKGSDKVGVKAGELEAGEEQSKTWEHFTGSKLNTLILSTVPNQDLPRCIYHQLIILTPLRPLSEIMAMLDWVLSHTFIKESLRIDLLYTRDTPEELAMMETAEAIQGINQNG